MISQHNTLHKKVIVIFLAALCMRLVLFAAVGSWDIDVVKANMFRWDDDVRYHHMAINIVENNPLTVVLERPAFNYFVAAVYYLFGSEPYIVIIFNILMGSLTCVFVYVIGRRIYSEKIALFAGLFLAFEYAHILYNNRLLSEAMFELLFIIHMYFLMSFLEKKNLQNLISAGLMLGIASLCRPVGLYFIIFLICPFAVFFRDNMRKGTLSFLIFAALFAVVVTPWAARNYILYGEFMLFTSDNKIRQWYLPNTFSVLSPDQRRRWTSEEKHMMVKEAEEPGMSLAKVVRKYGVPASRMVNWRRDYYQNGSVLPDPPRAEVVHPEPTLKKVLFAFGQDTINYFKGTVRFLSMLDSGAYPEILGLPLYRFDTSFWEMKTSDMVKEILHKKSKTEWFFMGLAVLVLSFLYSTFCYGVYAAFRKKDVRKIILFLTVVAYFIIVSSGHAYNAAIAGRVRLPVVPYMTLISFYGIYALLDRNKIQPVNDENAF